MYIWIFEKSSSSFIHTEFGKDSPKFWQILCMSKILISDTWPFTSWGQATTLDSKWTTGL